MNISYTGSQSAKLLEYYISSWISQLSLPLKTSLVLSHNKQLKCVNFYSCRLWHVM